MFCKSCGKEITSENNFCPYCGASVALSVLERGSLKFEIKYSPSYALLEVQIPENERIIAEAGALTYMSSNISVETRTRMKETGIWGIIISSQKESTIRPWTLATTPLLPSLNELHTNRINSC